MPQIDNDEVSAKSTKGQILDAYNKMLAQLKKGQTVIPIEEKKSTDEKKVVKTASATSSDLIVSDLAALKIALTRQIDTLNEGLSREFEKFKTIQQAVEIEQRHLDDLYKIKETAETFSALLLAQKQQEERFDDDIKERKEVAEREMQKERETWKISRDRLIAEYKLEEEALKKKRMREEEEYKYALELARRKDEDDYQDRANKQEKDLDIKRCDLDEREAGLQARETELGALKAQVAHFAQELADAVKKAEQRVTAELSAQHKFDLELRDSKVAGERNLYEQKIKSQEAKIVEQDALIKMLTKKADESAAQVQFIACRALDTSAQRFVFGDKKDAERAKEAI